MTKRAVLTIFAVGGAAMLSAALLSAAPAAVADDACGAITYKSDGSPWACTFADNFTGLAVNTTRWTKVSSATTKVTQGPACLVPGNATVSAGTLKLKVTRSASASKCYVGADAAHTSRYKGAGIVTGTKFQQAYGAFEIRARYPAAVDPGLWGGWLMMPQDKSYGPWPAYGEIDAAEWWSRTSGTVLPSLHYTGGTSTGPQCGVADASAWHTYRFEWFPRVVKSYIDGQLCWEGTWDASHYDHAEAPFDTTRGINLVMGVDPEHPDPSGLGYPQTYEVDYVKGWK